MLLISTITSASFYFLWSIKKTVRNLVLDIALNKPENFEKNFSCFQKKISFFKPLAKYLYLDDIYTISDQLPNLLGIDNEKNYFVLFQNNLELRPSGGFIGSYAKLKFVNGSLKDFIVQDIYVPDGQISGHVDPPWPIQQAFQQGWWRLRDSNWELNFPTAAKQIAWFFEKGKEEKADGVIALNLLLIEDILKIFETINLPDYEAEITAETLYQYAQTQSERDFFPGSTQKKDFLSSLTKHLILKLEKIEEKQLLQLIKVIKKHLDEKQILISLNNENINKILRELNWDGAVVRSFEDKDNRISDYLYIVDTNLGVNKANCCVKRIVNQEININESGLITEVLKINYINSSSKDRPAPPLFWGGVYKNFLRVILAIEAENIEIKVDGQPLKERLDIENNEKNKLKTVGFFVITQPLSESVVEINYQKQTKTKKPSNYYLEIQKQPGIESYSHNIKIKTPAESLVIEKEIRTDEVIKITL